MRKCLSKIRTNFLKIYLGILKKSLYWFSESISNGKCFSFFKSFYNPSHGLLNYFILQWNYIAIFNLIVPQTSWLYYIIIQTIKRNICCAVEYLKVTSTDYCEHKIKKYKNQIRFKYTQSKKELIKIFLHIFVN